MLDFAVTSDAIDLLYQRQSTHQPLTIFDKTNFKTRDGNPPDPVVDYFTPPGRLGDSISGPFLEDTQPQNPVDRVSDKFARQIDIPSVLGLQTTDKTSLGVWEAPAPVRESAPIDATLLHNSVVDNLQTIRTEPESPLGSNFAGKSVVASGQDPIAFYASQGSVMPSQEVAQDVVPPEQSSSSSWLDWLTTTAGGKSIKGEVTIIIVGLILLAIGIFALTR